MTRINATLTAAQNAGTGTRDSATRCLLEALSKNEADNPLGLLADAILHGGGYYAMNGDDVDAIYNHAETIRNTAEEIADAYVATADYYTSPACLGE